MMRCLSGRRLAAALLLLTVAAAPARAVTITSLEDDFSAPVIDPTKWTVIPSDFEAGTGVFTSDTTTNPGQLTIAGTGATDFWGGQMLQSLDSFPSNQILSISVDRVSQAGSGSAHRTLLQMRQADGTHLMFSQNVGEGGWQLNQNSAGTGANIAGLDPLDGDLGNHKMQFLYVPAGGSNAVVVTALDGNVVAANTFGGDWDNTQDYQVRIGALARATGDTVTGVFDNVSIGAGPSAMAQVDTAASTTGFTVADNDLLQGMIPTVTGNINAEEGVTTADPAALTNGMFGDPGVNAMTADQVVAIHNNTALKYELDLLASPAGYTIDEIHTYSGWRDGGRDAQDYLVLAEFADSPGELFALGLVSFNPPATSPSDTAVFLSSPIDGMPLAVGVSSLTFVFGNTENGYVGYREFDVFGTATTIIPEPATALLGLIALAALTQRRRRA